jgi:hypothetical protein
MAVRWTIEVSVRGVYLEGCKALDIRRRLGLPDDMWLLTSGIPVAAELTDEVLARRWLSESQTESAIDIGYGDLTADDVAMTPAGLRLREDLPPKRILALWVATRERRQAEEDVKNTWIAEHGSPRLRRLTAEGIEHESVYMEERLAAERPDWCWALGVYGEAEIVRNARQEGLDLLDRARETDPSAKLVWWVIADDKGRNQYEEDDETDNGWKGYACTAKFLDRGIVFGVPEEYAG